MDIEFQIKLHNLQKIIGEKQKIVVNYDEINNKLMQLEQQKIEFTKKVMKEKNEYDEVQNSTIKMKLLSLILSKEGMVDKEKEEFTAAKAEYDECIKIIKTLKGEMFEFQKKMDEIQKAENQYSFLLGKKVEYLKKSENNAIIKKITELENNISEYENKIEADIEIIEAGTEALILLKKMDEKLRRAVSAGRFDIVWDEMIFDIIKSSQIKNAMELKEKVNGAIERFNSKLGNIGSFRSIILFYDSYNFVFDLFFDNIVTDMEIQKKLTGAILRIEETIEQIEGIIEGISNDVAAYRESIDGDNVEIEKLIINS